MSGGVAAAVTTKPSGTRSPSRISAPSPAALPPTSSGSTASDSGTTSIGASGCNTTALQPSLARRHVLEAFEGVLHLRTQIGLGLGRHPAAERHLEHDDPGLRGQGG